MKMNRLSLLSIALILFTARPMAVCFQIQPTAQALVKTSKISTAGLKQTVTVRRDERGIPYIEADNEEDLYFAQGFVTASDRLWQMDLLRRTARGELAEILGPAALEEDKRHRTLGYAHVLEMARVSAPVRAATEAYARGVNAYIATLDDKTLPLEFKILGYTPRPWTPADSYLVGKNFSEVLSTTWRIDIFRAISANLPPEKLSMLLPVTSPQDVLLVGRDRVSKKMAAGQKPSSFTEGLSQAIALRTLKEDEATLRQSQERLGLFAEDLAASNNWVVSGSHTVSGKPLLSNDPHLSPSAPSIWYMTYLSAPGLRVAGVTAPGTPGIIIGHNDRIAWGVTNLGSDVQDLYREKFDPQNPRRYLTPAGWREAEIRREEIKVRTSAAQTTTESVIHEVTVTQHGPIIFEQGSERYALRWVALEPAAIEFEGFYYLNRARNWRQFEEALKRYQGPAQNFVYADVDCHIGYYGAGRIPIRKTGDGSIPYDGATDKGEWIGYISHDALPHVYDPSSGFIVTANNRIVGTSYPYYLTSAWVAPMRARRIQELLSTKKRLTAEDFRATLGDTHSVSATLFARDIVELARASGLGASDEQWRSTLQLLDNWDGNITSDSRAALLVAEMRTILLQKFLESALGAELAKAYRWPNSATFLNRLMAERPPQWLPAGYESYAALLDAVHSQARTALAKRLSPDESKWVWGSEAIVRFQHPLAGLPSIGQQFAIRPFPQDGSGGDLATVNVGAAVSMRLIADLSDWDKTQQGIALGQSGDPRSPHWQDQLADWRAVTPRAFPFTAGAIQKAAKEILVLCP